MWDLLRAPGSSAWISLTNVETLPNTHQKRVALGVVVEEVEVEEVVEWEVVTGMGWEI